MEVDDFPRESWHCCTIFPFFYCGRVSFISIELISIPKNFIVWHGSSTDFLRFIRKPRFWRRYIRLFFGSVSSSFEEVISRILSRKIISRKYSFHNRKIGILVNFVDILGAGPKMKQRHRNWQNRSFHLKLTNFWDFWFSGTEKYASLRSILYI